MVKKRLKKFYKHMRSQTKPRFIWLLASISIFGFLVSALFNFGIIDLTPWIPSVTTILLGIALIIESNLKNILKKKKDLEHIMHSVTGIVGIVVLIGGFISLPVLNLTLPLQLMGVIGISNLSAILVVLYELVI